MLPQIILHSPTIVKKLNKRSSLIWNKGKVERTCLSFSLNLKPNNHLRGFLLIISPIDWYREKWNIFCDREHENIYFYTFCEFVSCLALRYECYFKKIGMQLFRFRNKKSLLWIKYYISWASTFGEEGASAELDSQTASIMW